MGYDFDQTHERILKSAAANFREYGFLKASIRQICKDAGVTNGAFYAHFESKEDLFGKIVGPAVEGLRGLYDTENEHYMKIGSKKEIRSLLKQMFSSNRILIRYLYDHADEFQLLLTAAQGTAYDDYCDRFAEWEKKSTVTFLEKCRPYIRHPENISSGIAKRMSFFAISAVFDSFLNGMTEEETVRESELASAFCIAGMKDILGI